VTVERVEFMIEEPSMEAALRGVLPRILGAIEFEIYPHQCKAELLDRLPDRIRGYASWLPDTWRIVVIVDRDSDECVKLKRRLEKFARDAGLATRTSAAGGAWVVVNRLAIEELEAWYFGDWEAVRAVYPRVPATIASKAKFRDPDAITGGTWEAFERTLQGAGYFPGGLRKIEAASAIGAKMVPARNRSASFQVLRSVLVEIATA
jgi:hypothetical protein